MSDDKYNAMMEQLQVLKKEYKGGTATEESKDDDLVVIDEQPSIEVELVNYEKEALKQGWVGKDKYSGTPEDFVDAKTFIERGKEFKKIQQSKVELDSENKKLQTMVKELLDNLKNAENKTRDRTLKEIEDRKRQAEQVNDLRSYKQLEQQEKEVASPSSQQQPAQATGRIQDTDEFKQFVDAGNSWATKDGDQEIEMRAYVTLAATKYYKEHPGSSDKQQYDYVHETVRNKFPDYFGLAESNSPKVNYSSNPGSRAPSKDRKTIDLGSLTDSQRMIYNSLKNDKSYGMTPEEYLKSLINIKRV